MIVNKKGKIAFGMAGNVPIKSGMYQLRFESEAVEKLRLRL